MNKNFLVLAVLFSAIISFASCLNNDDEDKGVSEEWIAYNNKQERDAASAGYIERESVSRNGSIYWKYVDNFVDETLAGTITDKDRKPIFTDSVSLRCEGWFYYLDGTKKTFLEDDNAILLKRRINSGIFPLTDGTITMLQNMIIDEQVEVCIPYMLGYGTAGRYSNNVQVIPGYTTLWFRIKLMNIYDDDPHVKDWVKR